VHQQKDFFDLRAEDRGTARLQLPRTLEEFLVLIDALQDCIELSTGFWLFFGPAYLSIHNQRIFRS
jgi:hypothetical protein